MRARGEGCAVDRTRAKAALWTALAEGRWQSSLAVAPSFAWFVAEDAFRYLVPSRGRGRDGAAAAAAAAIARASASVTSGSGLASRLGGRAAAPPQALAGRRGLLMSPAHIVVRAHSPAHPSVPSRRAVRRAVCGPQMLVWAGRIGGACPPLGLGAPTRGSLAHA